MLQEGIYLYFDFGPNKYPIASSGLDLGFGCVPIPDGAHPRPDERHMMTDTLKARTPNPKRFVLPNRRFAQ